MTFFFAAAFTPATQFSTGQLGLWADPSDYTTLFQDSAGTTPVTAVTQPDGLMLDKRLGLVRGPELVPNGDFSTTASWTIGTAAVTIAGGVAVFLNEGAGLDSIYQLGVAPIGGYYEVTFTITEYTSGSVRANFGNLPATAFRSAVGTYTERVYNYPGGGNANLIFKAGVASTTLKIDNVSIKLLGGNHLSQATAASRPLTNTQGAVQYLTFDGIDDSLSTGAITLGADMDCFIAVRRSSAANAILAYAGAGNLFAAAESGAVTAADTGSGTPTYAANGVPLNSGLTGTTRAQVFTSLPAASWVVLEVRNLNLATGWTTFGLGNLAAGFQLNGDIAGIILAPAGDATARQKNRQYLGAKVGLTLP